MSNPTDIYPPSGSAKKFPLGEIRLDKLKEKKLPLPGTIPIPKLLNSHFQPTRLVDESELYRAFLKLNYDRECSLFKKYLIKHPFGGCFLIEYAPNCGQGFLLNRLIKYIPRHEISPPIIIDFGRRERKNNFSTVLSEIGSILGADNPYSRETISQIIFKYLTSRNIIFIFNHIHKLPESESQRILDFWQYLSQLCQQDKYPYKLLIFLMKECQDKPHVNDDYADKVLADFYPDKPVKLKAKHLFNESVLTSWFENISDIILSEVIEILQREYLFILSHSQQDLPEFVMEKVCWKCKCEWSQIKSWLKI